MASTCHCRFIIYNYATTVKVFLWYCFIYIMLNCAAFNPRLGHRPNKQDAELIRSGVEPLVKNHYFYQEASRQTRKVNRRSSLPRMWMEPAPGQVWRTCELRFKPHDFEGSVASQTKTPRQLERLKTDAVPVSSVIAWCL